MSIPHSWTPEARPKDWSDYPHYQYDDEESLWIGWDGGSWHDYYYYPNEAGSDEKRPVTEVALRCLMINCGIPTNFIPFPDCASLPPDELTKISAAIADLGGQEHLTTFAEQLRSRGILICGYLGSGGWAHVFRARHANADPSVSGPDLALKVLKPPYSRSTGEWRQRFNAETRTLRKLSDHKSTATIVDELAECSGLLYFTMTYVDGYPLISLNAPVHLTLALSIARSVLTILRGIHDLGIIHRDIHLGNIMSTRHGLVLLDFGVSRDEYEPEAYMTFKPIGAMSYCAPEKWYAPRRAGRESDLFSIGVVLYKLLTNTQPFYGESYVGLYESMRAGVFTPVSQLNHDVPSFIDITMKELLAANPSDRVQTADQAIALLDAMEPLLRVWYRQQARQKSQRASAIGPQSRLQDPIRRIAPIAGTYGLVVPKRNPLDFLHYACAPMPGRLHSHVPFNGPPRHDLELEGNPFVRLGSFVKRDELLGILEYQKIEQAPVADVNGIVVEALVQDGDLVDMGQPLLTIWRTDIWE